MCMEHKLQRRRAFSLIMVLIIFLIGVSVSGGVMYMVSTYAGGARSGVALEAGYNVMQDGLEQGKTVLKERLAALTSGDMPPKWTDVKGSSYKIKVMEDLLIRSGDIIVDRSVPAKDLGGRSGKLSVKIYDLQYKISDIDTSLSNAERMKLPPLMNVKGNVGGATKTIGPGEEVPSGAANNVGVYLIRSSLKVDGDEKALESVVVQSKK